MPYPVSASSLPLTLPTNETYGSPQCRAPFTQPAGRRSAPTISRTASSVVAIPSYASAMRRAADSQLSSNAWWYQGTLRTRDPEADGAKIVGVGVGGGVSAKEAGPVSKLPLAGLSLISSLPPTDTTISSICA